MPRGMISLTNPWPTFTNRHNADCRRTSRHGPPVLLIQRESVITAVTSYPPRLPHFPCIHPVTASEAARIMRQNVVDLLTVLVVDDFADARLTLKRLLETRAYRVLEATNGQEAVELAQRRCPDLILLDLNMPKMDGLE